MPRTIGSKNKNSSATPLYFNLAPKERILIVANLIVDQVIDDQANNRVLFKKIMRVNNGGTV